MKAVTWSKDSHGLFDYEYKHKDIEKFAIKKTTTFLRKGKLNREGSFFEDNGLKIKHIKEADIPFNVIDENYLTSIVKKTEVSNKGKGTAVALIPSLL